MKKINITKILEDCPKGIELYSPLFGELKFENASHNLILCQDVYRELVSFESDGKYISKYHQAECMLFPSKDQRDWSKFQRPFKDGDILANVFGGIVIYKGKMEHNKKLVDYYCGYRPCDNTFIVKEHKDSYFGHINDSYYANEEEKQKLFDAIKANGSQYRFRSRL